MIPCISQATLLTTPFAESVAACADIGWPAIEIWLTTLEKHLETASLESTKALFGGRPLPILAASYQGGLCLSQGEQRRAHFEHFQKRLELCQALKIPTMTIAADHSPKVDAQAWERAVVSLKQAGQSARGYGVALAFEFRGSDAFCTNLASAAMLVEACGEENVGLCLDLFHYYKGPSKLEDLHKIDPESIKHVHMCDVAGGLREIMTDSDRILPGEGDFDIQSVTDHLKKAGYRGALSLELLNPLLWNMKPSLVAEMGLTATRRFI